jgi:hypothetical protein
MGSMSVACAVIIDEYDCGYLFDKNTGLSWSLAGKEMLMEERS